MSQELLQKGDPFSFYAFQALYTKLNNKASPLTFDNIKKVLYPDVSIPKKKEEEDVCLFVTWNKLNRAGKLDLRGCIGTFHKLPILEGIEKYSLIAALQDTRFSPISAGELPKLTCSCNILSEFEVIYKNGSGDIYDWNIGEHGIRLVCDDLRGGGLRSATFLPEVMVQQQWDKKTAFVNLIEKAGCMNALEMIEDPEVYIYEVSVYTSNKSQIGYEGFKELLDKVKPIN
ncbi:HBL344Wp [Eremothecium sinecaudum]|uniref:HBL344Wp n=1 Tax=Eremothecium sinecaudum TaxID=45286 RepID=A0A109UVX3_9SACH|nr:HBL344Wp [Eremothecium sinecaudum]AMD18558.1 HBL344Wp [Eremothecium sinecaudum]